MPEELMTKEKIRLQALKVFSKYAAPLGLEPLTSLSTAQEIDRFYKKLARKYHPDKCASNQKEETTLKFQEISNAHDDLKKTQKGSERNFSTAGSSSAYPDREEKKQENPIFIQLKEVFLNRGLKVPDNELKPQFERLSNEDQQALLIYFSKLYSSYFSEAIKIIHQELWEFIFSKDGKRCKLKME
jgi:curved DNA-binding protein CbpA